MSIIGPVMLYVTMFMFVTNYVTIWVIKQSAVQLYKLSPSMDVCIIDAIKPIYTDVHGSAYLSGNATADHLKLTNETFRRISIKH